MPRSLPPELQLEILELAIPPPTLRNLEDRRKDLLAFSLVHRDWTPTAQRALLACPSVRLTNTVDGRQATQKWLQQRREGCMTTSLEMRFEQFDLDGGMKALNEIVLPELHTVDRLLVPEPEGGLAELQEATFLKSLSWRGSGHGNNVWFRQLPASLTSLTLLSASLRFVSFSERFDGTDDDFTLPLLPHLTTLIIADTFAYQFPYDGFTSFPKLRNLAWYNLRAAPDVFELIAEAPELKLEHLLIAGEREMRNIDKKMREDFEYLPRSITLVEPPADKVDEMRAWCEQEGVLLRCMSKEEGEELDLELWALSL